MYTERVLFTSTFQFSKYDFIHPIGGKLYVYGSQKEGEVGWYSIIFLGLHYHGSGSVGIQKALTVTLSATCPSYLKAPQGPVKACNGPMEMSMCPLR